jgi:hypothetical protein
MRAATLMGSMLEVCKAAGPCMKGQVMASCMICRCGVCKQHNMKPILLHEPSFPCSHAQHDDLLQRHVLPHHIVVPCPTGLWRASRRHGHAASAANTWSGLHTPPAVLCQGCSVHVQGPVTSLMG